jgi:hypothetical protein
LKELFNISWIFQKFDYGLILDICLALAVMVSFILVSEIIAQILREKKGGNKKKT